MLFNSLHFLFFLPVITLLYYLIPSRFRWVLLLAASSYFYMAFVPEYILVLFAIILIDYFCALAIEKRTSHKPRKLILLVSILSNLAILCFFKYSNFLLENLYELGLITGIPVRSYHLDIILPIGLSFHTFQSMSYVIEVYRKNQSAEKHLGYFANYVLFFPQMVAGPIEKYSTLGVQLRKHVEARYENFSKGFRLILFGFFVKMVIADNLAPFVNGVYQDPSVRSSLDIFLAVIFFSVQIYADFYGYSLIAMGAASMLGISLIENFRTPYLAASITEFWKRWHISLTDWFRNYVYIPLGGNRVSKFKWLVNILTVFFLSGLWHGASWTFVIWGLLHGVFYIIEYFSSKNTAPANSTLRPLKIVFTFLIVSFIWIFFRAESFANAGAMFKSLLVNTSIPVQNSNFPFLISLCVIMFLCDLAVVRSRVDEWLNNRGVVLRWICYTFFLFFIVCFSGVESFPFIYFQF